MFNRLIALIKGWFGLGVDSQAAAKPLEVFPVPPLRYIENGIRVTNRGDGRYLIEFIAEGEVVPEGTASYQVGIDGAVARVSGSNGGEAYDSFEALRKSLMGYAQVSWVAYLEIGVNGAEVEYISAEDAMVANLAESVDGFVVVDVEYFGYGNGNEEDPALDELEAAVHNGEVVDITLEPIAPALAELENAAYRIEDAE